MSIDAAVTDFVRRFSRVCGAFTVKAPENSAASMVTSISSLCARKYLRDVALDPLPNVNSASISPRLKAEPTFTISWHCRAPASFVALLRSKPVKSLTMEERESDDAPFVEFESALPPKKSVSPKTSKRSLTLSISSCAIAFSMSWKETVPLVLFMYLPLRRVIGMCDRQHK